MKNVWQSLTAKVNSIPFSDTEKAELIDRWKQYLSGYAAASNPINGDGVSIQTLLLQLQKRYHEEGVDVLLNTLMYMITPKKFSASDLNSFLSTQGINYFYDATGGVSNRGSFIEKKEHRTEYSDVNNENKSLADCPQTQEMLERQVLQSHKEFWETRGKDILFRYRSRLCEPDGATLDANQLDKKLSECKVLLLTANSVEGAIVSQCLLESSSNHLLERITADKLTYQFATFQGKKEISVVHIWPQGTSSFTIHGSFHALRAALHRFHPTFVFSLGVAFGASPSEQEFGDVLVSERLVFYDAFNKITDRKMTLSPDEVQLVGEDILAGCQFLKPDLNSDKTPDFHWHLGTMLTGGTVLSDSFEKQRLFKAVKEIGQKPIGGEMEGSGVYFACNISKKPVPFLIVKGICDWGVNKNGWDIVTSDKKEKDMIKNCIQAFATENAFITVKKILSRISF